MEALLLKVPFPTGFQTVKERIDRGGNEGYYLKKSKVLKTNGHVM